MKNQKIQLGVPRALVTILILVWAGSGAAESPSLRLKPCDCSEFESESGPGIRLALEMNPEAEGVQQGQPEESDRTFELKSESAAFNASLLGTLIPLPTLILTLPGLIVGPSLGYFRSDLHGRAWLGIGIRTAGVGGVVSSFAICGWDCGPGDDSYNLAWAVFLAGSAITVGSAIYDIATVKASVRKRNTELEQTPLSIAPVYFSESGTVGIGVSLRL